MGIFHWKKKKTEEVNPYAAPITPYQQARAQLSQGPAAREGPASSTRDISAPDTRVDSFASGSAPPPPYKQSPAQGDRFGDEKYGNQKGYGSNPYDTNASAFSANQRGPGGYGGFDEDTGKNDLFGNAGGRYVPPQQNNANSPALSQSSQSQYGNDPNKSALLRGAQDRYNPSTQPGSQLGGEDDEFDGYGAPRELTEEEKDKMEARKINAEINAVRDESLQTTGRSVAVSNQTLEVGMGILARLGAQGDRLHNTERNLDTAAIQSRTADEKSKELKKLNGSMFAFDPHMPFTGSKREEEARRLVLEQHRKDRETRETTRANAFSATQNMEERFKEIDKKTPASLGAQRRAENSRFVFREEDDDDEEGDEEFQTALMKEKNLDRDVATMTTNMGRLKGIAYAIGDELESQNALIDRIGEKSDAVDDHVRLNRDRLARIH